jgi:hypothetical protein
MPAHLQRQLGVPRARPEVQRSASAAASPRPSPEALIGACSTSGTREEAQAAPGWRRVAAAAAHGKLAGLRRIARAARALHMEQQHGIGVLG